MNAPRRTPFASLLRRLGGGRRAEADAPPGSGGSSRGRRRLAVVSVASAALIGCVALLVGTSLASPAPPAYEYDSQNTGSGTPAGSFGKIYDVVTDCAGHVYVADVEHAAVYEFTESGAYVGQVTGAATPGKSLTPVGLAVSCDGRLYVSDSTHKVVDEFASDLADESYLGQVTGKGSPAGAFGAPRGLALDGGGHIYVVDGTNKVVDEFGDDFTTAESYVSRLTGAGSPAGSFSNPFGVVVSSAGDAYVGDYGNSLVDEFTAAGAYVGQVKGTDTPAGSIKPTYGMAVNAAGEVLVPDYTNKVVDFFSGDFAAGEGYVGQVTGAETPGGAFGNLYAVALAEDEDLYVADKTNNVVDKFVPQGGTAPTEYKLNLSTSGGGTGSFECKVGGGAEEACQAEYEEGKSVEVIPHAASGSEFVEWTGDCTGSGACTVTMGAEHSVGGVFGLEGAPAAPTVTSVSPDHGSTAGGETITVEGTNLGSPTKVEFGTASGTSVTEVSATKLTVESPAHAAGQVDVTVTTAGGTSATGAADEFTYEAPVPPAPTVTSVSPDHGSTAGGETITVEGTNLGSPTGVSFGGAAATEVTGVSATKLTAKSPAHAAGQVDVTVTTAGGTSATGAGDEFTYEAVSPKFKLTVTASGGGFLTVHHVISADGHINCGGFFSQCEYEYPEGASVSLEAVTSGGPVFKEWTGDCSGSAATCVVPMTAARTVGATFAETYKLAVTRTGGGSGTVTSADGHIDCGGECEHAYEEGASVTLEATATEGTFAEWTGACSGSDACVVPMTAAKAVGAKFVEDYPLTIAKAGGGSGTVTSADGHIDCGTECEHTYEEGTAVTLQATATEGTFKEWTGACSGSGACTVAMTEAAAVGARFVRHYGLTVSLAGPGTGSVSSIPTGISCGPGCSAEYEEGTSVALTAAPAAHTAVSWGGCDSVAASGQCVVAMTRARGVTATFTPITRTLSVSVSGSGSGTVSSSPAGIDCGARCSASFGDGSTVTLTASAAPGSEFLGFSGAGCAGAATCRVEVDSDASVVAQFRAAPASSPGGGGSGPAPEGTPKVGPVARVRGGVARVTVSCRGAAACEGTLKLRARIRRGKKKPRWVVIGRSRYQVAAGKRKTIKVRITDAAARRALAEGRRLRARLSGPGLKGSVTLRSGNGHRRHARHVGTKGQR